VSLLSKGTFLRAKYDLLPPVGSRMSYPIHFVGFLKFLNNTYSVLYFGSHSNNSETVKMSETYWGTPGGHITETRRFFPSILTQVCVF